MCSFVVITKEETSRQAPTPNEHCPVKSRTSKDCSTVTEHGLSMWEAWVQVQSLILRQCNLCLQHCQFHFFSSLRFNHTADLIFVIKTVA